MATIPITLKPAPGFCVKSTTLQPAAFSPRAPPQNTLEPQHAVPIPKGIKVFVNICWDNNVPAPPDAPDHVVHRAMQGQDTDEASPDGWYVPVVVSDGRTDKDKAGNPSLVFDCVYNSSVKSRTLRDPQFKIFLVELALQRIEAKSHLVLSRQIGTPNISAKGKLEPRTVNVPTALLHPIAKDNKPLVQEVDHQDLKGILKKKEKGNQLNENQCAGNSEIPDVNAKPTWTWDKGPDARLRITIHIPAMTRQLVNETELDLEPRRLLLNVPHRPTFEINLNLSDAEIVSNAAGDEDESKRTLLLKRQRDFDVDLAEAEWRVADNTLIISC